MESFDYLIIGGGMTAASAVKGIREHDFSGKIGIISEEHFLPYNRPPLTKGLWFGKPLSSIWRKVENENVSVFLEKRAVSLDPEKHLVKDDFANQYQYKKLLLATGSTPRRLDCPDEGVIYYRTLSDYYKLRELYDKGNDFVVIGSGFIGTEIAAALAMNGKKVTMIFRDASIGAKKLPKNFSYFLNSFYTEKGVQLIPNQTIQSVSKKNEKLHVLTHGKDLFVADGVIAGLGVHPNIELARLASIEVGDGVLVDEFLKTSQPDIYAAGDLANFYSPHLEKRVRIEHEDCANSTGHHVGKNMAGAEERFEYLPFFYSDLFELGYEAIGEIDNRLEMVEDWQDLYRHGIIYYLQDKKLRGAIAWGVWKQIDRIRKMMASKETFTPDALAGKITT